MTRRRDDRVSVVKERLQRGRITLQPVRPCRPVFHNAVRRTLPDDDLRFVLGIIERIARHSLTNHLEAGTEIAQAGPRDPLPVADFATARHGLSTGPDLHGKPPDILEQREAAGTVERTEKADELKREDKVVHDPTGITFPRSGRVKIVTEAIGLSHGKNSSNEDEQKKSRPD